MNKNTNQRLANIFANEMHNSINLETVFKDRNLLIAQHVDTQNRVTSFVSALIVIITDLFWLFVRGSGQDVTGLTSAFGLFGLSISTFFSVILIIVLKKTKGIKLSRLFNAALFAFKSALLTGVFLLALARSFAIAKSGDITLFNGIPLSSILLMILVFIPSIRKRDSLFFGIFMFVTAILPQFICPKGTYVLTEHLVLRLSITIGFFGIRGLTLRNASMIEDLADASYLDFQTKALNRKALTEYLENLGSKDVGRLGIMMYDIDDFKSYNDEYSHSQGDIVLNRVCESISEVLEQDNALIFRYGSGEFIAIFEDITDENLVKTALKVRDAVQNLRLERRDGTWRDYITVTIGCTSASKNDCMEKDILGEVDSQLFIGKKGTKNCVVFKGRIFIAEGEIASDQQPTQYTERVSQAITEAMKNNEIVAYYQPLFDTMTHKLVGAEALSRWVKSDGTVILPGEYIPELEKNSSVLALDWYMFRQVCMMLKRQKDLGIPQVRISVNFSRMHALYERSIEKRLCEIADAYGIPHNLIEIEITESAYIHLPNIIEPFIKSIRAEGFAVAVDDFGSGASSLGFVKSVDVDTLKIDKSLISSNCEDEKERVLLESVVYLAQRLQLVSVAEGVETQEQLGLLKTLGCDMIQGYIFAKPMPEDAYLETCKTKVSEGEWEPGLDRSKMHSSSIQMLLDTVFKKYPIAIMSNVTRNSFYSMTYESFTNHQYAKSGRLTDILDELCSTMHPDDIEGFQEMFSLENQKACYYRGDEKQSYVARLHGDGDLDYKKVEMCNYFMKEKGNDDIIVITLCSEPS